MVDHLRPILFLLMHRGRSEAVRGFPLDVAHSGADLLLVVIVQHGLVVSRYRALLSLLEFVDHPQGRFGNSDVVSVHFHLGLGIDNRWHVDVVALDQLDQGHIDRKVEFHVKKLVGRHLWHTVRIVIFLGFDQDMALTDEALLLSNDLLAQTKGAESVATGH
jgi:hypothetical protein